MTHEQLQKLFIFAIIGAGFRDVQHAIDMERLGFARFVGNQHNPEWEWKKEVLKTLGAEELAALYTVVSENEVIE